MKKILISSLTVMLLIGSISMALPSVYAAEVPGWIKNNAGWWADGTIDDGSFVSGIEWLVSNGIIEVPATAVSGTAESTIPGWVKNTAGWWAGDQISDDDFVNAIQHLIKVGIMSIPQAEQASSPEVEKLLQKREAIIDSIWKGDGFPTRLPDSSPVKPEGGGKITVEMKHDINSIMYLKHATGNIKNELVIWVCGHGSNHYCDNSEVNSILSKGYSVLKVAMPLKGQNSTPSVDPSPNCPTGCKFYYGYNKFVTMQDGEKSQLLHHNQLEILESDDFSPMTYFVEPIAVALNYVDENFDYSKYHIAGVSGGGWTAAFYSAIDPRISHSFSIAGSHPSYSMTQDYEQRLQKAEGFTWAPAKDKKVYQVADWKDLYVLASFGEDRKLTQWFHSADECCFAADELNFNYEDTIKKRLASLGSGEFEIFIEDTSRHACSSSCKNQFLKEIG